ncbi:MAG TPA: hypothetical protein VHD31_03505 [Candidatus Paceibacterota bacterium]|nr:hypothetical protein [Candidatus Paceibacterota bacterium]
MQDFKKRDTKVHHSLKFGFTLIAAVLLFGVAGVAVTSAWGMYGTFSAAVDARHTAEAQYASLQADHARVAASVASFDSPEGIEMQVRDRFGVVKPGEGEIQIVRNDQGAAIEPQESENIFVRIFHSLFVW